MSRHPDPLPESELSAIAARALLAPAPGGEGEPPRPTDHGGEG